MDPPTPGPAPARRAERPQNEAQSHPPIPSKATTSRLCENLNATETHCPGTNLRLRYVPLRLSDFPGGQDVQDLTVCRMTTPRMLRQESRSRAARSLETPGRLQGGGCIGRSVGSGLRRALTTAQWVQSLGNLGIDLIPCEVERTSVQKTNKDSRNAKKKNRIEWGKRLERYALSLPCRHSASPGGLWNVETSGSRFQGWRSTGCREIQ